MTNQNFPAVDIWHQASEIAIQIHRQASLHQGVEIFAQSILKFHLADSFRAFLAPHRNASPQLVLECQKPNFIEIDRAPDSYNIELPDGQQLSLHFQLRRSHTLVNQLVIENLCEHIDIAARHTPFFEEQVHSPLSKREQEVYPYLLEGRSNSEIGAILGISPRTVEKHVASILRKYHCETRVCLLARSHQKIG